VVRDPVDELADIYSIYDGEATAAVTIVTIRFGTRQESGHGDLFTVFSEVALTPQN